MENVKLTSENYFQFNEYENMPVLSHSLLKHGMPMNGGSQYRMQAAWEKLIGDEESPSKKLGSLLHKYVEDPGQFIFQPEWDSISPKIQAIAEKLHRHASTQLGPVSDDPQTYADMFELLCSEDGWGQSWKPETRYNKFREVAMPLWLFMQELPGKIPLHGKDLESIQHMIKSIEEHGALRPILEDVTNCEFFAREFPIFFIHNKKFPCKVLLDIIEVNHTTGTVEITDLKTTAYPVMNFIHRHTYAWIDGRVQEVPFTGAYVKYNYFTQEHFYKIAVKAWLKEKGYDPDSYSITMNFAVIETGEPYEYADIYPSNEWGMAAGKEISGALSCASDWFEVKKYWKF